MALDKFDQFGPLAAFFLNDVRFADGAEAINFLPVLIALGDNDGWAAIDDGTMFRDSVGWGRKDGATRVYFATNSYVENQIALLRAELDKRHYFDPATQTPQRYDENGVALGAQLGDIYVAIGPGTFDGQVVSKADIFEAINTEGDSLDDYLFNQAKTGLEEIDAATTNSFGTVMLVNAIAEAGASATLVATENAVRTAINSSADALTALINGVQSNLQTNIDAVSNTVAGHTTTLADHASRITSLEEWDEVGVDVLVGNGTDADVTVTIPAVSFKTPSNVMWKVFMSTPDGYVETPVLLPIAVKQNGAAQEATLRFKSAPATNAYQIRLIGQGKAA